MTETSTRRMGPQDLDVICRHRQAMYEEAGFLLDAIEMAKEPFRRWLEPKLKDGSYMGWAIETEGVVVGGAGMIVLDWPPHPLHPMESRRGYMLNVYVDASERGTGLAKHLMLTMQAEAREQGIGYLALHASDLGRPVYERMGWRATNEMSMHTELAAAPAGRDL